VTGQKISAKIYKWQNVAQATTHSRITFLISSLLSIVYQHGKFEMHSFH